VPSFANSKDMTGEKFKKTGHVSLTTPICHSTCTQNLATLASAVPWIWFRASKLKMGHITLTTPFLGVVCHLQA